MFEAIIDASSRQKLASYSGIALLMAVLLHLCLSECTQGTSAKNRTVSSAHFRASFQPYFPEEPDDE